MLFYSQFITAGIEYKTLFTDALMSIKSPDSSNWDFFHCPRMSPSELTSRQPCWITSSFPISIMIDQLYEFVFLFRKRDAFLSVFREKSRQIFYHNIILLCKILGKKTFILCIKPCSNTHSNTNIYWQSIHTHTKCSSWPRD